MLKLQHEIRDPIHNFVRISSEERAIVDSRPVQRLRHIHQLALSSLVYPGATHRRFEHSLGVMELAGRIFDVVTADGNLRDDVKERYPTLADANARQGLRASVRLAALLHDIGHLPFSHAAEKELLPAGVNHEVLTLALLEHGDLAQKLAAFEPPLKIARVQQLAVGVEKFEKAKAAEMPPLESLLCEIIVGDALGADRMDYLLRDSFHAGVAYGRFDHYRLIDTIRFLPSQENPDAITLGVEYGGLQSAEAMALARYFMYSQVYMHPVRRIYDFHLMQFLKESLENGLFPTDPTLHLDCTDNEIFSRMNIAAFDTTAPGHVHAKRIMCREHFKVVFEYRDGPHDPTTPSIIAERLVDTFGAEAVRLDEYDPAPAAVDFPVLLSDEQRASSLSLSKTLQSVPSASFRRVYVDRTKEKEARQVVADYFNRREGVQS